MVEVVTANEGDGGTFPDEDHIPPSGKLDKACAPHKVIANPSYYIGYSWQIGNRKKAMGACLCMNGFAMDGMGTTCLTGIRAL